MINFLNINYILSHIRKTVDKYGMIEKGDKIAVGVSGGKDSLTLLTGLYYLSKFKDYDFDVFAVIVDCGFDDDYSVLIPFFEKINVDYSIVKTDIKEIDREVVVSFIKKIEVYDDKTIDIYFNFKKPSFIA